MDRIGLRSLDLGETIELVKELGHPRFRGGQVFRWDHERGVTGWEQMGNVPKALREQLAERASLDSLKVAEVQTSSDGTRKMRLETSDGKSIETVLIPDGDKLTQ